MPDQDLRFDAFFPMPREQVFNWFATHETLGRLWGARFTRIAVGKDPQQPNGLGSVRELKAGAFKFEETITAFQPHRLIEYTVTKGGPLKNHFARIAFADAPGGTQVQYTIQYDAKMPGTGGLFAATLRLAWNMGVAKVVRQMESGRWSTTQQS